MTSPNTPVDVGADLALIERLKLHAGKRAPVQGLIGGIPWSMHLRAYDAYCKRWGAQDALIDLEGRGCRGGFGTEELDDFIPGWRAELERPTPPELATEAASALSRLLAERREMLEALKLARVTVAAQVETERYLARKAERAEEYTPDPADTHKSAAAKALDAIDAALSAPPEGKGE